MLRHIGAGEHGRGRAQFFGQLEHGEDAVALRGIEALQPRRLDVRGMPAHVELAREPRGGAHGLRRALVRADTGQDRARGVPGLQRGAALPVAAGARLLDAPAAHVVLDVFGGAAQGDLAQRDQVALAEEVLRGALRLLRQVDLAGREPRREFVGRDVDQHHLVGLVEHGVGHGLVHAHAGDGADGAVEAFQVLHVECRPHLDAGGQQLLHVLPALGVARAGRVGVGEFVDQQHGGLARQCGVEVELRERAAPVGQLAQRQRVEPREQRGGLAAAVGFDHADEHVAPGLALAPGGAEHGPGLADTGTGTEVDAQLAAQRARLVAAQLREQGVGVGAGLGHGGVQISASARSCAAVHAGVRCATAPTRRSPAARTAPPWPAARAAGQ
ncbi:hypothetical protein D3C72_1070800 [compost metagenome]